MVSPRRHPLTTCLLLAAYLAAGTFSSLFHDHACNDHACSGHACTSHAGMGSAEDLAASHDHSDHEHGDHDHGHHHHGHHHHDAQAAEHDDVAEHESSIPAGKSSGQPLHDDDCAVCRFVGQLVTPVTMTELAGSFEFHVEVAAVHASQPTSTFARTTRSRAPPLLG